MTEGWIVAFLLKLPYVGLFAILFVAGLGVPLPEDIPLLAAGWLVHKGHANLQAMIAVGMVGVLVGDFLLFSMGRRYGVHITEHRFMKRIVKPALLHRAEEYFAKYGSFIIFLARFMPGLRSVLFVTAGIFRVRPVKFVLIDGTAALASVPLLIWLGERFGEKIESLAGDVRNAQLIAVGCLVGAIAAWCAWEYYQVRRRRRLMRQDTVSASVPVPHGTMTKDREGRLVAGQKEPAA